MSELEDIQQYKRSKDANSDDLNQYSRNPIDSYDEIEEPPYNSESFLSKLPRNILIGLAKGGHSILNLPHDVAQGVENSGGYLKHKIINLSPSSKAFYEHYNKMPHPGEFKLSEHIPYQKDYNFAQMLGQKGEGTLSDKILQKGIEYAPEILSVYSLFRHLPITKYPAVKLLNKVQKEISERGLEKIKIPEHIFKDIEENQFLRNTQPNRNLLENARQGGYKSLFDLQSDLGAAERGYTRDIFNAANRQFGRDIGVNRQNLLKEIRSGITTQGHKDLSEDMKKGQDLYRIYMKLRPYRNAAIGLGIGSLGIPYYSHLKKFINP